MIKINNIKGNIVKAAGRSGLVIKKYSPEILMTAGVVGIVTTTVMACRATLKVDAVLEKSKETIDKIHYAKENVDSKEYTEKDYKRDMTIAYLHTGADFAKLYGPSVTLGIASIGCMLGAHSIMKKRNVALMAAYKLVEQSFSDYRHRVVEDLGEEKDKQYKYGIKQETHTVIEEDEDGKKKKVKKTVEVIDPNVVSQYARFFDEASPQWSKTPEYNLIFLKCQQNYMNDLLKARGHVFLNEVYDALGIPRSQAGAVVGWVLGQGDDFIDFGIYDLNNESSRDFVNGYERSILLDFNIDGVIYDLI